MLDLLPKVLSFYWYCYELKPTNIDYWIKTYKISLCFIIIVMAYNNSKYTSLGKVYSIKFVRYEISRTLAHKMGHKSFPILCARYEISRTSENGFIRWLMLLKLKVNENFSENIALNPHFCIQKHWNREWDLHFFLGSERVKQHRSKSKKVRRILWDCLNCETTYYSNSFNKMTTEIPH